MWVWFRGGCDVRSIASASSLGVARRKKAEATCSSLLASSSLMSRIAHRFRHEAVCVEDELLSSRSRSSSEMAPLSSIRGLLAARVSVVSSEVMPFVWPATIDPPTYVSTETTAVSRVAS